MAKLENSLETIELLMDKMLEKGIESVFVKDDDFEIKIVSRSNNNVSYVGSTAPQAATQCSSAQAEPQALGNIVKSPIVGTFYSSSSPDDKPFASVGQSVKKGDTLFIIESMKVMNEVHSEFDGVISEICVNNGDSLEFDQTVMVIK